jgi:hypothetical protein
MELYAGAAVMGLFVGAAIGQATGRVVNTTIDMAVAGAGRAYNNLAGKDPNDPETRIVLEALEVMDVNSKLRLTTALIQSIEHSYNFAQDESSNDPLKLCVQEVKLALDSIEEILNQIDDELERHRARLLSRWRTSHVHPLLKMLQMRLDVLDKRLDMLAKCKTIQENNYSQHKKSDAALDVS